MRSQAKCTTEQQREKGRNCIEYPVARTQIFLEVDRFHYFLPLLNDALSLGWGLERLTKYNPMGNAAFINTISVSLSKEQRSALAKALRAARAYADDAAATTGPAGADPVNTAPAMSGRERIWSMQTDAGFSAVSFDPDTGRRRAILVSPVLAAALGMHPEEYLARAAARDLPLPSPDVDSLLHLLCTVVERFFAAGGSSGGGGGGTEHYVRMAVGPAAARRGALVCVRSVAVKDGAGRVCEVRIAAAAAK